MPERNCPLDTVRSLRGETVKLPVTQQLPFECFDCLVQGEAIALHDGAFEYVDDSAQYDASHMEHDLSFQTFQVYIVDRKRRAMIRAMRDPRGEVISSAYFEYDCEIQ